MFVVSLQTLAEEAILGAGPEKRDKGNLADLGVLFEGRNLELLEAHYNAFGYLAFDPRADKTCLNYVIEGTLASDAGPKTLVFFASPTAVPVPTRMDIEGLSGIDIESEYLPAQEMLAHLFFPDTPPPLPGIAFLRAFSSGDETIFYPMGQYKTTEELRQQMRELFSEVANAAADTTSARAFVTKLAVASQSRRQPFRRGSISSPKEWLIKGFQAIRSHAGDVIAAIGLMV